MTVAPRTGGDKKWPPLQEKGLSGDKKFLPWLQALGGDGILTVAAGARRRQEILTTAAEAERRHRILESLQLLGVDETS